MQKIHHELVSLIRAITIHSNGVQFDSDTYELGIVNDVTLMHDELPTLTVFIGGLTNLGTEAAKANIQVVIKRTPTDYLPMGIPFPKHRLDALDVAHRPKATFLLFVEACMAAGMSVSNCEQTSAGLVACLWGIVGDYGYEAQIVIAKKAVSGETA